MQNADLPAGTLQLGQSEFLVRHQGQFRSLQDIERTIVSRDPQGNHVTLGRVAAVVDTYAREEARSRLEGRRSIALGVTKKDVGSSLDLLDKIHGLLEQSKQMLPSGMYIDLVNDTSIRVRNALVNLQTNALAGGVLVIVVLWLFIGWRNSILTAIGIPITFSLAFIMLKAIGSSINENTLFGLVLVLGMVVDDAIVVIENVYRYLQMGYERSDAVITGTQEVLSPVLTSTLTTIAAFMPLVLLPGNRRIPQGRAHYREPGLACISRRVLSHPTFSHCRLWGRPAKSRLDGTIGRLTERYTRLVSSILPSWRRYAVAIGAPRAILVSAGIVFPQLRQELFSSDPQSYFAVWLTLPEGTALDETDRQTQQLESVVRAMPPEYTAHIERILVNVGVQNTESRTFTRPNYAEVIVDIKDGSEVKERLEGMVDYMRQAAAKMGYTQEEVRVKIIENGPPKDYPIEAKIQGDDFATLDIIAEQLKDRLASYPGLINIGDDYVPGKGELTFQLRRAEAQRLGLTSRDVGLALQSALNGQPGGQRRR